MNTAIVTRGVKAGAMLAGCMLLLTPARGAVPELKDLGKSKGQNIAFKSTNPRYAKIAMDDEGGKVLTVAFDESRGAGRGYDTLYVLECDDQGTVLKYEQFASGRSTEGDSAVYTFRPVRREVSFKKDLKPGKNPFSVGFEYRKTETKPAKQSRSKGDRKSREEKKAKDEDAPRAQVTEEFGFSASFTLSDGKSEWGYMFSGKLDVGDSAESAPVANFGSGSPEMSVSSGRPDEKKSEVGIGIEFKVGSYALDCTKDSKGVPVTVDIKNDKEKIVAHDIVRQDALAFQVKTRTRRSGGCSPGG